MPILNVLVIPSSFSVAVIFSTDLLPSGLVLLCELKILFIRQADKENLSLVSTTRCSFKRRSLVHTSGGHYSGYTLGEGILNNGMVITSGLFEIRDG